MRDAADEALTILEKNLNNRKRLLPQKRLQIWTDVTGISSEMEECQFFLLQPVENGVLFIIVYYGKQAVQERTVGWQKNMMFRQ